MHIPIENVLDAKLAGVLRCRAGKTFFCESMFSLATQCVKMAVKDILHTRAKDCTLELIDAK